MLVLALSDVAPLRLTVKSRSCHQHPDVDKLKHSRARERPREACGDDAHSQSGCRREAEIESPVKIDVGSSESNVGDAHENHQGWADSDLHMGKTSDSVHDFFLARPPLRIRMLLDDSVIVC